MQFQNDESLSFEDTIFWNQISTNYLPADRQVLFRTYAQHLLFILEKCSVYMLCDQHGK